jgi:hypothetical protein
MFHRRGRQNAVTEVEDVAGASSRALEHLVRRRENAVQRPE